MKLSAGSSMAVRPSLLLFPGKDFHTWWTGSSADDGRGRCGTLSSQGLKLVCSTRPQPRWLRPLTTYQPASASGYRGSPTRPRKDHYSFNRPPTDFEHMAAQPEDDTNSPAVSPPPYTTVLRR